MSLQEGERQQPSNSSRSFSLTRLKFQRHFTLPQDMICDVSNRDRWQEQSKVVKTPLASKYIGKSESAKHTPTRLYRCDAQLDFDEIVVIETTEAPVKMYNFPMKPLITISLQGDA
ncbi:hypothetical protein QBC36DRAFT_293520 [Triangularia setosa]|uniref:Uncharacterized protein n=1 Tax=Triangularia setosa TaxID=2587417 RepID=A0AAN6W2Z7_9PEZI|nr:hypothetical protein QBC36DRAFT_293520 [Podospora setosa]